jgi:hypothetical protein
VTEHAYHSDEWVGPKTYWECESYEQDQGGAGDKEERTCLAKNGEFASRSHWPLQSDDAAWGHRTHRDLSETLALDRISL